MIRIKYTLDNGTEHYCSQASYGSPKPFKDSIAAQSDISLSIENLLFFTSDNGEILVCSHIASARIVTGTVEPPPIA